MKAVDRDVQRGPRLASAHAAPQLLVLGGHMILVWVVHACGPNKGGENAILHVLKVVWQSLFQYQSGLFMPAVQTKVVKNAILASAECCRTCSPKTSSEKYIFAAAESYMPAAQTKVVKMQSCICWTLHGSLSFNSPGPRHWTGGLHKSD